MTVEGFAVFQFDEHRVALGLGQERKRKLQDIYVLVGFVEIVTKQAGWWWARAGVGTILSLLLSVAIDVGWVYSSICGAKECKNDGCLCVWWCCVVDWGIGRTVEREGS